MQFLILLQWTFLMDVFNRRFIQRRLIKIRGNQEPLFHFNLKLSMVGVCSTQVYQIFYESFFGSDVESGATHSLRVRTVKRLSDGGESIVVVPKMLLRAFWKGLRRLVFLNCKFIGIRLDNSWSTSLSSLCLSLYWIWLWLRFRKGNIYVSRNRATLLLCVEKPRIALFPSLQNSRSSRMSKFGTEISTHLLFPIFINKVSWHRNLARLVILKLILFQLPYENLLLTILDYVSSVFFFWNILYHKFLLIQTFLFWLLSLNLSL